MGSRWRRRWKRFRGRSERQGVRNLYKLCAERWNFRAMMSMPRQFQLCIGILSLWVIAPPPLVVVAEPLVIETPTILEKIRVASTSQLWNGVDGTVFHRLGGST